MVLSRSYSGISTCKYVLLPFNVENIESSPWEQIHSSDLSMGFESRMSNALNLWLFIQNQNVRSFVGSNRTGNVHCVWAGSIASIANNSTILHFPNFCSKGPAQYGAKCLSRLSHKNSFVRCLAAWSWPNFMSHVCWNFDSIAKNQRTRPNMRNKRPLFVPRWASQIFLVL